MGASTEVGSDKITEGEPIPVQEIPARPTDMVGGFIWDMTYGLGNKVNPFMKVADEVGKMGMIKDGVSDGAVMFIELNGTMKQLLEVSRELNDGVKEMLEVSRELNENLKALVKP